MSLRVWLPLNGTLDNQGLDNVVVTNNGATIDNNGKIGKCYSFDGSNDKIQISNAPTPVDISIAMWFKRNATTNTRQFFYTQWPGITLELDSANKITCSVFSNGSQRGYCTTNDVITINSGWVHICFVFENGVGAKLYINGLQISSASLSTPIAWGTTIGNIGYFSTYLNACINDFRIYDHALSTQEVKQIAQGLVLHFPLNRNGWGNENLLSRYVVPGQAAPTSTAAGGRTTWLGDYKITIPATQDADTYFRLFTTKQLTANATYTISCKVDGLLSGSYYRFPLYAQNNTAMGMLYLDHNGLCSLTFTMTYGTQTAVTGANGETVYICFMDDAARAIVSGQGAITISNFKLEEGDKATPWCPNSADEIATSLGMNSNIEYDISGFKNNATRNNITYSLNSPKYQLSSVFNGSNSYIKVNENNWAVQGTDALTINFWAYSTDWTTRPKLISCTESGGWNTENGTTGHIRVPIYVYTNAEKTTKAYKYSSNEIDVTVLDPGWHMFTIIYNLSGNRIYIDGQPHSNYDFVSYGICYNMSTRLFLGCEAAASGSPSTPYLNGNLSDFRIYNTVLLGDDIKELYKSNKLG